MLWCKQYIVVLQKQNVPFRRPGPASLQEAGPREATTLVARLLSWTAWAWALTVLKQRNIIIITTTITVIITITMTSNITIAITITISIATAIAID